MFATAAALHDIEKRYKTFTLGPLTLTIPAGIDDIMRFYSGRDTQ